MHTDHCAWLLTPRTPERHRAGVLGRIDHDKAKDLPPCETVSLVLPSSEIAPFSSAAGKAEILVLQGPRMAVHLQGGLAEQQGDRDEVLAKVGAGRPLGRLAEPGEIAAVVVFLLSERAGYVTGAAWSADGGSVPIII